MSKPKSFHDDIDDQIKGIAKDVAGAVASQAALKTAIREAYGRNDDQRGAILEAQLAETARYIRESEDRARKLQSKQILQRRREQGQQQ